MQRFHTSYRCRPISETLELARELAGQLGISRVTDTTWLDRIGVPVFSSVRPGAAAGGLCVNSGKGFTTDEARAGAYMEAIEFAMAEPNRAGLTIHEVLPRDVYAGRIKPDSILDFCPRMNYAIDPQCKISCVEALDVISGQSFMVPAELIFYPSCIPDDRESVFSSSTNGLASGNSFAEAVVHGILEVMERDVLSFHFIEDNTRKVTLGSLPCHFTGNLQNLENAGIELVLRYAPNVFGLPVFMAFVIDPDFADPMFINAGYGCHTDKDIAVSRAIAEGIQSRLVLIHGARDDIPRSHDVFRDLTREERTLNYERMRFELHEAGVSISYDEIEEKNWSIENLDDYLDRVCSFLSEYGFEHVLAVRLTKPSDSLQVVRTIIPGAEFFNQKNKRFGKRLKEYATRVAHNTVRRPESAP